MAEYEITFTVDLNGAGRELTRLATAPPVPGLEGVLLETFVITQQRVHVITGYLRASGRPDSDFDGTTWSGTISYDRYPGIYELARGDTPTAEHPEGGHFFFDPVEGYPDWETGIAPQRYEAVIEDWLGR